MPFIMVYERTSRSKLGRIKENALKNTVETKYFRRAAYNSGRRIRTQFEKTTKTWSHDVKFKLSTTATIGSNMVGYSISTNDRVWHWLDRGTSFKMVMSNPEDPYQAKTSYGAFASYPGSGSMIPSTTPTDGIEPREWSESELMKKTAEFFFTLEINKQSLKIAKELRGG